MLSNLSATAARVNALAMAPFQANLPISTVALLFLAALILAAQWRFIIDRIEEVEE